MILTISSILTINSSTILIVRRPGGAPAAPPATHPREGGNRSDNYYN